MEKCVHCGKVPKKHSHYELCNFLSRSTRERSVVSSKQQRIIDQKRNNFINPCKKCKLVIEHKQTLTVQIQFCEECSKNISTVKKSKYCLYFY